ncbi:alpha-ketoacid dehydrogenase subunit beta [Sphingosinicella soli]|uniref:Pyruvate dehydrogenase E1 component beta subunit n=1 Tax=Sphingosinicella soli TaxID=333708 RepID=A0A7W7B2P2_9SPHN|nr:transketolase C-terminal domain-containing protein [Sphingosinicella soli]MBB4631950.1 pyruvate dehydrogenase E1 component beta subunit [Sphingosinicella soli]
MNAATDTNVRMITGPEATNMALDEALAADPHVLVFGEDVADGQGGGIVHGTKGLSAKYGDLRVRSTPISEQAILGAAVGAAVAGMRPVAEIMLMNFLTVGMDQLVNHAAKIRFMSGGQTGVPLTIRTMSGAGGGFGGQHSDMLEAWLAHVPGLKVVVPSDPTEWKGLLTACIFDDNPCVFIESTMMVMSGMKTPAPEPGYSIPLGKANVARVGTDVSVIGYGRPIADVHSLAERLGREGISVEVIDLRTIAPLDMKTVLASVAKTKRAVIVHEAVRSFGVGAEIAAHINEDLFGQLAAPVRRVASKNTPVPYSSTLEKAFMWSEANLESAVRSTLTGK